MKITVTGGAGFIGSNLVDAMLEQGHTVVVVDNLSTGKFENLFKVKDAAREKRFAFFHMDIRDPAVAVAIQEQEADVVVHLAGQSSARRSASDPVEDAEINILGTINLLQLCVKAGVKRFVNTSSGECIYGKPESLPVDEDAPRGGTTPFAVSKNAADLYLQYFGEAYGIAYITLALAHVYGPRQNATGETGAVAILGGRMLRGEEPVIYGDGEQTRDFVFVDDVVDAYLKSLEAGEGELLNIGSGIETSINQLFAHLRELTGFEGDATHAPAREGELRRSFLKVDKAKRVLGWQPRTSLTDGLERTVDWLRGTL